VYTLENCRIKKKEKEKGAFVDVDVAGEIHNVAVLLKNQENLYFKFFFLP